MLTKIKLFLKNYWIFIFLAFLAIFVAGIALSKKTPPPEIKHELINRPTFKWANIKEGEISFGTLIKDEPIAPQDLPVFLARPKEKFDYSLLLKTEQPTKTVNSPEDCLNIAIVFLRDNNRLTDEIEKGEVKYKYYKIGGMEVSPAYSFNNADLIVVNIYPRINNLPVVQNSPFRGLLQVWIDKNGQVKKAIETLAHYDQSETKTWPIKTFQEAFKQIEEQKGIITAIAQHEDIYNPQSTNLEKIVITKAYLSYFQEENLPAPLQPVWVFEGETKLEDGTFTTVSIYLPAIKEDYLTISSNSEKQAPLTPGP